VSSQGYHPDSAPPVPSNGTGHLWKGLLPRYPRPRYWLHLLLLALTALTTTAMGTRLVENFQANRPAFDLDRDLAAFAYIWRQPSALLMGLPFSLTLIAILLAHEFGHYLACRYYRVDASLPYFIPAPTFIGTFGAFIRIRSPIYTKQVLFDVGIAGPLAGFAVLLPALGIGLAYSKVLPGIGHRGDLVFGVPALVWLAEKVVFPGVTSADVYLHPVARAAWVGIFATALNLLPIGQLDGGHILYSFIGERHRTLSKVLVATLIPLGIFTRYWPWYVWAAVLLLVGLRHPVIFDATRLTPERRRLGYLALAIFALCFMVAPIVNP
jgi:membrane-associated protease RseP (regulator of RpoE activity)